MENIKNFEGQLSPAIRFFIFCYFFFFAVPTLAAGISFYPSSGSRAVGATFPVSVYVSSPDQQMNAASGVVSFPRDLLEVVSLSKAGSVFSLWVQEPTFSNSDGAVNFEGVVLNPGFTGSQGKIFTINFRVKKAGQAALNFSAASVLANDGQGTNILSETGGADFSLVESPPASAVQTTPRAAYFNIREIPRSDLTIPRAKFIFDIGGQASGIDRYEVGIDGGALQIWRDDGSHTYETDAVLPGKHTLVAKAVDKQGNYLADSAEFTVDALESPVITEWPAELQAGEPLVARGTSKYPNAKIIVWLQYDEDQPKSQPVPSDGNGNFVFAASEKSKAGLYELWAEVVNDKEARSNPTDKKTIAVGPAAFLRVGTFALGALSVMTPLAVVLLLLLFMAWYGWHEFALFKKKIRQEVHNAESSIHKVFDLLKEDIHEQIKLIEHAKTKRALTAEEEKIVKQLKKDLDEA